MTAQWNFERGEIQAGCRRGGLALDAVLTMSRENSRECAIGVYREVHAFLEQLAAGERVGYQEPGRWSDVLLK